VFRLILGFGMAPGFSLGATMVAESWPERYRALGIGILDTGWGIGAIGAAIAYGVVYPLTGWRGMFFVGAVPAVLLALFIALRVPDVPAAPRPAGGSRSRTAALELFRLLPGRVALLTVLMLVLCFGSWPFQGLFPTYLRSLGLSPHAITTLTMISAVGQIAGFFSSGLFAERLGRRNGISLMLILGTASLAVLVEVIGIWPLALLAAFLSGFFLVGSSGIWGTILTENLPREVRATGVGFLYNVGVIGGGGAPFIVLKVLQASGYSLDKGIICFTVIASLAALVILRFVNETKGVALDETGAMAPVAANRQAELHDKLLTEEKSL
jgi:SHS family sialic acid transporter-like MFS transporter